MTASANQSPQRTRTLGALTITHTPMGYVSSTDLGKVIAAMQQAIRDYSALNLQGQFAAATVSGELASILNAMVLLDQSQQQSAGQNASYVSGLIATYNAKIANLENQLQGGTPSTNVAPPPPAPAPAPGGGGNVSATAPAPAPATTPTGTYVSVGATTGIAAGTGLLGGIIGWFARGKHDEPPHHTHHPAGPRPRRRS